MTLATASPIFPALLNALVTGEKVYAMQAPQGDAGPFIIFTRVTSERWRSANGPSGVAQETWRIDCYDTDYNAAKALSALAEETLDGYRGTVYYGGNSPQDSVRVAGISFQGGFDIEDKTDEPFMYRDSATYLVTYHQL